VLHELTFTPIRGVVSQHDAPACDVRVMPVIQEALFDIRNKVASAMSSGDPNRPSGCSAATSRCCASDIKRRVRSVSTAPAHIVDANLELCHFIRQITRDIRIPAFAAE